MYYNNTFYIVYLEFWLQLEQKWVITLNKDEYHSIQYFVHSSLIVS